MCGEGGREEGKCSRVQTGGEGRELGSSCRGFHIIYSILGESRPRAPLFFVYSALTKEDIDQKRH